MKVCTVTDSQIWKSASAVALGFFDGVHRGHAAVIRQAVTRAGDHLQSVVLTFSTSPHHPEAPLIMSETQKEAAVAALGADMLVTMDFEAVKNMTAQQFVEEILIHKLHAREICCGFNYRFGRDAQGDGDLLRSICGQYGVQVTVLPPVMDNGDPISSTRIRKALEQGDVTTATRLLGRPFAFDFVVVDGDHRGRLLGAPTINQPFPERYICPRFGVYVATAAIDGQELPAVSNIGIRPTVGADCVRAETYILGFDGDLYGQEITVSLYQYLRPEKKFPSLDALREAIHRDAETAQRYVDTYVNCRDLSK